MSEQKFNEKQFVKIELKEAEEFSDLGEQNLNTFKQMGKKTNIRMGLLFVSILLVFFMIALISQLFRLQIIEGDYYNTLASQNHYKRRIVYPERGRIEDANGEILAMTTYVYTIGATPKAVRSYLPDVKSRPSLNQIAKDLSEILEIPEEEISSKLAEKDKVYVQIIKEIEKEKYDKLRTYIKDNSIRGLSIDITDKRYYPNKDIASAVIGYANRRDKWISGVLGIENYYNKELSGQPGFSFGEVDHYTGRQLPYSEGVEQEAIDGHNVVLHLNLELQRFVQEQVVKYAELYDAQEGAGAVVMNAKTGAILAMAQSNNFDLNNPLAKPTQLLRVDDNRVEADRKYQKKIFEKTNEEFEKSFEERVKPLKEKLKAKDLTPEVENELNEQIAKQRKELDELLEKRQKRFDEDMELTKLPNPANWNPNQNKNDMYFLNNRVWQNIITSSPFEAGSTIKSFTVAAGLEEHVVSQNEVFSDAPIFVPGWDKYPISCWFAPNNHGFETVEEALGRSCNPVMVQIAERLGIEKFHKYMKALGLYETTGIDLPFETRGVLHDELKFIDMATFSFGEQNTLTAIQLLSAYTSLTNNGAMLQPQMVKYITDRQGRIVKEMVPQVRRQVFSRETSERLLAMLRSAVTKGIVKHVDVPGYQVGGKTGTSTKMTNELYPDPVVDFKDNYAVGSVMTVFPISNPQYIVYTFLRNPRTDIPVAQQALARNIIREIGKIYNIKKIYAPGDIEKMLAVKSLNTANSVSLNTLADYLLQNDFDYDIEKGLSPQEPFFNSYPPSGTQMHGLPILYISRDGSMPSQTIDVPDFTGMNFMTVAEYARSQKVNVYYTGNVAEGKVVRQSIAVLAADGTRNKMIPYSVITLHFEKKENEPSANSFTFRVDPLPEPDISLPVRHLFKRQTYSDYSQKNVPPQNNN